MIAVADAIADSEAIRSGSALLERRIATSHIAPPTARPAIQKTAAATTHDAINNRGFTMYAADCTRITSIVAIADATSKQILTV